MTDILDHLQPDSPLYEATRDAAREEITRLRAYVERLEKRLEIDAVWQCGADGNMTLVEIPKSERADEPCDGIFCRDETIKLQNEAITNLRSRLKDMAEALINAQLQIEYLHDKFKETGTGNAVIAQIEAALKKAGIQ